ncbi:MAG: hypothetical protein MRY76_08885 [Pseudomonadales bacterium]|nr:hypothetical protein [Pseudomonadales bacterium]
MSAEITRLSLTELASDGPAFRRKLYEGLREHGFIILRDHSIDAGRLEQAYALTRQLFALPLETKLKYDSGKGAARGYTAFGRENAVGNQHADLKEFWHIGPELGPDSPYFDSYPDNFWPEEISGFRNCFSALYKELEQLGKQLLSELGQAMGLERDFLSNLVKDGNSVYRLLHYPALTDLDSSKAMRAAPHADINLITLLVGATDSGLELLSRDGSWLPVESQPDEIVVDTGDMMSRLTNDMLPSTVHRVVNPNKTDCSRYAMPFFLHPHSRASLTCPPQCAGPDGSKYPPITAGEFLQQRLRDIGLMD